jgi:DNA polymerase delta subunit 3
MASYKEFLATRVLSESSPVTYRLLSRELKIHVHAAKQMLFDFYTKQNGKNPNSIHATFIVSGLKQLEQTTQATKAANGHDEDVDMEDDIPKYIKTVSIVKEEDLEGNDLFLKKD